MISYSDAGFTFADSSTQATSAFTGGFAMRNRIINGAMVIDQRNAGASVTPTTANPYTLDRWRTVLSQNSKFTLQQNAGSVTPPTGFAKYLGITSSSAYSVVAGDFFFLQQQIEGFNAADFAWGTASASSVTISFWVRSSLTGTFGGSLQNSGFNRSYPFTYTISLANTWEQKSITISGDTTGTWSTDNSSGIKLQFGFGVGSTYSGTAGAWSGSEFYSATGSVSIVATSGATFYITGVQLEKGSTATPFDYRPYGTELSLCQRYFRYVTLWGTQASTTGGTVFAAGLAMRTTPTISGLLSIFIENVGLAVSPATVNTTYTSAELVRMQVSFSAAGVIGYSMYTNRDGPGISLTAEL